MQSHRRYGSTAPAIFIASLLFIVTAWAPASASADPGPPMTVVHVSPDGSGSMCAPTLPCGLPQGQQAAREAAASDRDVVVQLQGGRYELASPLTFTALDSGRPGRTVSYRGDPANPAVLSGGRRVSGWQLLDASTGVYAASLASLFDSGEVTAQRLPRVLWVDGRRAVRARTPVNPPGFTRQPPPLGLGYEVDPTKFPVAQLANAHLEVVSHNFWKQFRCGARYTASRIVVDEPCWSNAHVHSAFPIGKVAWIENGPGLLDQPDEWYLDAAGQRLLYKPPAGQDPAGSEFVLPVLEQLVDSVGPAGSGVRNLELSGLTFAHSAWYEPNSTDGFAVLQDSARIVGVGAHVADVLYAQDARLRTTPGAVAFHSAERVRFVGNTLRQLGSTGLVFDQGAKDNLVQGNTFDDISASGIRIGDIYTNDHHPSAPAFLVERNRIADNRLTRAGAEFAGSSAITLGFTAATSVVNNEMADLPYTGVAAGWGLGFHDSNLDGGLGPYPTPSAQRDLTISGNLIHDYMKVLFDGGGVYISGANPGALISENVIFGQQKEYGAIYLDQGAKYETVRRNVVFDNKRTALLKNSPHLIADNYWQNRYTNDIWIYSDYPDFYLHAASHTNRVVNDGRVMPASIINAAGPRAPYASLKLPPSGTDSTAPSAPGAPALSVDDKAQLIWQPAVDDVAVTGYEIHQDGDLVGVSSVPRFALPTNGRHCYQVLARDAAANLSAGSTAACLDVSGATPPRLARPTRPVYVASSENQDGKSYVGLAFDGNLNTRWTSGNGVAEVSPHYAQLLYTEPRMVDKVVLHGSTATDVEVGTALWGDDGITSRKRMKVPAGEHTIVLDRPVLADFVRVTIHSSQSAVNAQVAEIGVSAAPVVDTSLAFTEAVPESGQYTDNIPLSAQLTGTNGQPIPDARLTFRLNGDHGVRTVVAQTGSDGVARTTLLADVAPGAYDLTVSYAGAPGVYRSAATSSSFQVLREDTTTTVSSGDKDGSTRPLRATVADADTPGSGAAEMPVIFYADGVEVARSVTDAQGVAAVDLRGKAKNAKVYTVVATGTPYFLGSSGTS